MTFVRLTLCAAVLSVAMAAAAQEPGNQVWGIRVMATDADAIAAFYEKTFGMSEVSRPVNSATIKEIVLNFGATPDIARKATTAGIAIFTRPANTSPGGMAALILRVPDLDKAIAAVKANGGTQVGQPGSNAIAMVRYVMLKDPDGNPIELVMDQK